MPDQRERERAGQMILPARSYKYECVLVYDEPRTIPRPATEHKYKFQHNRTTAK